MTIAQRLACLEGASTLGILGVSAALWLPTAGSDPDTLWALSARAAIVAVACVAWLYFNDRYDFEFPHDLSSLFRRPRLFVKRLLSVAIAPGRWVFFMQGRVGLRGRTFRLITFRTTRVEDCASGDTIVRDNESRVTRVGAGLRRYRLDELPQLINILRGHMSLVGPRPEMEENGRHLLRPHPVLQPPPRRAAGLDGLGAGQRRLVDEHRRVTYKLCYDIKHMSFAFDLRILFDTVKFVLSGKKPG
jgi:lipopolysaccharide/colanic/teichoic acid biosynthesis glycosyltransferase